MRSGRFVGRRRERELLEARLAAALAGDDQVALVAGEPGAGKSRLAEEITSRADDLGMAHAWGRATDDEGSPPYWPFRQVIRALGGSGELTAPEVGTAATAAQER